MKFKLSLLQFVVGKDKQLNLDKAAQLILKAVRNGSKVIALPECFNSPYGTQHFSQYAEPIPSSPPYDNDNDHQTSASITSAFLSKQAKEHGIYLIGGSIPERFNDKLYNACTIWNPKGELIAKYRKIHLFDISIPGKISFSESSVLSSGHEVVTFDTEYGKMGIGICYDLRFPELAVKLAQQHKAKVLFYPGAFNMTTGPLHWHLLLRSRAVDNQVFVAGISPARDVDCGGYVAYGHSLVVDPWGRVMDEANEGQECIVTSEIDTEETDKIGEMIPIFKQKKLFLE